MHRCHMKTDVIASNFDETVPNQTWAWYINNRSPSCTGQSPTATATPTQSPTTAIEQCQDNHTVDGMTTEDYCTSWCDTPGVWGCGKASRGSYTCDCTGCGKCGAR